MSYTTCILISIYYNRMLDLAVYRLCCAVFFFSLFVGVVVFSPFFALFVCFFIILVQACFRRLISCATCFFACVAQNVDKDTGVVRQRKNYDGFFFLLLLSSFIDFFCRSLLVYLFAILSFFLCKLRESPCFFACTSWRI